MRIAVVLLTASALALTAAGCKRREEAPEAPAAPDAPAAPQAPQAPPAPPQAVRKAGLWEMRMSSSDNEFVQTTRFCVDAESERKMSIWGPQVTKDMCSKNNATRRPDGTWAFSSVCDMGSGGKVTTAGTLTGDFERRYQMRAESSTTGAAVPQMNRTSTLTIDASWVGRCEPGMKGGDMILPGGIRMNALEAAGR
ncbi:MAG TPA: DUF3617 family protein [Caulobacteraceae bacterium]|nr:DUF3617 family protein [Caulobacteraceae bacterium]